MTFFNANSFDAFYFIVAGLVDTLYSWSAFNTEEIGNVISDSFKHLVKTYPVEKIHLIGHSLGAHSESFMISVAFTSLSFAFQ